MRRSLRFLVVSILAASLVACGSPQSEPTGVLEATLSASTPSPEATSPSAGASSGECSNDYLPTGEGSSWVYKAEGGSAGTQTRTSTIMSKADDGFSVEIALASGATFVIEWSCSDGDLTHLTPTASLSLSGGSATGSTTTHSGVTLPADLDTSLTWRESGEWSVAAGGTTTVGSYTSDNTAVGLETVTVPFGTVEAMRVDSHLEGTLSSEPVSPCEITQWWAKDIGLVKQETSCPVGGQMMSEVVELVSYDSP